MKQIVIISFLTLFSIVCRSQNFKLEKNDSSLLKSPKSIISLSYNNVNEYAGVPENVFDFCIKSRYVLYYNSYLSRSMLYDNYRHQYVFDNALTPYSNFRSALLGGTLNTVISMFYKKD